MIKFKQLCLVTGIAIFTLGNAKAGNTETITTTIYNIDEEGVGAEIGTINIQDTEYGVLLTPDITDIPSGIHGFHLHENPSCDPGTDSKDGEIKAGLAAGGHYDPQETGIHQGPYGEGHLGDLPPLVADEDGNATLPILAPRLYPEDLEGRALIIHLNGDNFADLPEKLGGGGSRLACGVVQ